MAQRTSAGTMPFREQSAQTGFTGAGGGMDRRNTGVPTRPLSPAQLGRSRAAALVFLVFLLSSFANQIHSYNVDHATKYAPPIANQVLKEQLQQRVVQLFAGSSTALVPLSAEWHRPLDAVSWGPF